MLKVLRSPSVFILSLGATTISSAMILKEIMNPRFSENVNVEGKVVIVTGSNSGIGMEVTRELAKRKCRVIMACRDEEKCQQVRKSIVLETKNSNVVCRKLDLASLKSVRKFAQFVNETEPKLDILINNAGVMTFGKNKKVTADGFESQIGVNHFGHFLLTNLLLEKLKSSSGVSRIVNVSSVAHKRGKINFDDINSDKQYKDYEAYAQSKLANVLFTRHLSKRVKKKQVYTYAVDPGLVNTGMFRNVPYYSIVKYVLKPTMWFFFLSPSLGAQTVLHCALSSKLEDPDYSGKYFCRSKVEEPSDMAKDDVIAKKLWILSESWTKLK